MIEVPYAWGKALYSDKLGKFTFLSVIFSYSENPCIKDVFEKSFLYVIQGGEMNYKLGLFLVLSLGFVNIVKAEANLYQNMQAEFLKAQAPKADDFSSGWYSGRCFLRRAQDSVKAGVLVILNSGGKLTVSIPASSIRDEAAYFDNIDADKYETYKDEVYLKKNFPAEIKNGSLVSQLYYDILIGDMHLRQSGASLIFALTNYQESPLKNDNSFFFCKVEQKVMNLQGDE